MNGEQTSSPIIAAGCWLRGSCSTRGNGQLQWLSADDQCWNGHFEPHSGQCICAVRCAPAMKCPSAWPLAIRSYYGRIFPDTSRIRTSTDAFRNAYPHKGGRRDDLATAAVDDGAICLEHGIRCYYVPSSVRPYGFRCKAFSVSGALYVYAFNHAPPIVRFVDTSAKIRS